MNTSYSPTETLDTATLDSLKDYSWVITAEDGIIDGGYGYFCIWQERKIATELQTLSVDIHIDMRIVLYVDQQL